MPFLWFDNEFGMMIIIFGEKMKDLQTALIYFDLPPWSFQTVLRIQIFTLSDTTVTSKTLE